MAQAVAVSPFSGSAEAREALARGLPVTCMTVSTPRELALHFAIRKAVFVEEQAFFEGTDRDDHDEDPSTLHVLGLCGRVAGGAVRLYPLQEPGRWKGDRLSVLPDFRKHGVGAPLVRFAVRTAAERGGRVMVAHIQPQNVAFFLHLGWYRVGEVARYVGRPHQQMAIDLTRARSSDP